MVGNQVISLVLMSGILITGNCTEKMMFAINTWPFTSATDAAFQTLIQGGSSLDAVVAGCSQCETDQCDGTVGWGGSPDEDGHTTLDALVMEGGRQDTGAVIQLKSVREASKVARAVLEHTYHTILVGENATNFALSLGFERKPLSSERSIKIWEAWKEGNCQPNYWKNMVNSTKKCGPYTPDVIHNTSPSRKFTKKRYRFDHDTIGMIALDGYGKMAVGTSTNGKNHKISGKDGEYGAACYGMDKFPYSVRDSRESSQTRVIEVECTGSVDL
ncbi:hypothetical protein ACHWQZ_G003636 [Mnemiopsis leidyi]